MRWARLSDMTRGWFVGDFEPRALRSTEVEVAVRHYAAGACEYRHHHRIATEVTLVVQGEIEMLDQTWIAGDIVVIEPGEATSFLAVRETICCVVKIPATMADKYFDPK